MNKLTSRLIVIGNYIGAIVLGPIALLFVIIYSTYCKVQNILTYKESIGACISGLMEVVKLNHKTFLSGDATELLEYYDEMFLKLES